MYRIILRSKSSEYLISEGCPEYVNVLAYVEKDKSKALQTARMMNEHIRKFHSERIGREYYFVEEV